MIYIVWLTEAGEADLNVQEYYTEPGHRKKDGNILLLIDSWKHKLVWGSSRYCSVGVQEERKKYY